MSNVAITAETIDQVEFIDNQDDVKPLSVDQQSLVLHVILNLNAPCVKHVIVDDTIHGHICKIYLEHQTPRKRVDVKTLMAISLLEIRWIEFESHCVTVGV